VAASSHEHPAHTAHFTLAGNHCTVHGYHRPTPLRTVLHHILPQEYGGPTVAANLVKVCDTGHYNIHACLDALLAGKPMPGGTRREKALARQGLDQIKKG
jgi:hypothetical protein